MEKQDDFSRYKNMKLYSDVSFLQLLNKLWVNKYCHYHWLIDHSEGFYNWSCKLLSRPLIHFILKITIGKVFTGGENF